MKPYVVAFIFARGGSKGVKKKNIRILNGKPLIAYAIEVALESDLIDEVIVSTDDPEIAEISRRHGAKTPFMRPAELAGDSSPEILSWKHAIKEMNSRKDHNKMDVFVSVPTTSPLRTVDDLNHCIQSFLEGDSDAVITVREAERSPFFNMVIIDEKGYAKIAITPDSQNGNIIRRQDSPEIYDITTVAYVAKPDYILKTDYILSGKIKTVLIPKERALDIDTEFDFSIAECILKKNKAADKEGKNE